MVLPAKRISDMSAARVGVVPHHSASSPQRSISSIWCILLLSVAATAIIFTFRSYSASTIIEESAGTVVPSATQILKPERRFIPVSSAEGESQREIIFQYPIGVKSDRGGCSNALKGVLYLYHGCSRRAASFFYSPQGRDMMMMALNAGLAVVAFTKENDVGCWSPRRDMEAMLGTSKAFVEHHLIPYCGGANRSTAGGNIPFFGFGASSGGSFVAQIATETASSLSSSWR